MYFHFIFDILQLKLENRMIGTINEARKQMADILKPMGFTFVLIAMTMFLFYNAIAADFVIERMSFEI